MSGDRLAQVWVEMSEGVSMAIDREEAMSLDREGFVKLYKRHVYPPPGFRARRAWKREAEVWADKQIADRAAALARLDSGPAGGGAK